MRICRCGAAGFPENTGRKQAGFVLRVRNFGCSGGDSTRRNLLFAISARSAHQNQISRKPEIDDLLLRIFMLRCS
jgi:hypothetical protein